MGNQLRESVRELLRQFDESPECPTRKYNSNEAVATEGTRGCKIPLRQSKQFVQGTAEVKPVPLECPVTTQYPLYVTYILFNKLSENVIIVTRLQKIVKYLLVKVLFFVSTLLTNKFLKCPPKDKQIGTMICFTNHWVLEFTVYVLFYCAHCTLQPLVILLHLKLLGLKCWTLQDVTHWQTFRDAVD